MRKNLTEMVFILDLKWGLVFCGIAGYAVQNKQKRETAYTKSEKRVYRVVEN